MEKSMSDPLLTLMEKTLKDLRSATSSLESVVGVMHSNLQDGQQIDLFGQDHHPVSHSQLQEKEKPKMTNDTSGHTSSISSESVRLQQYLASKLPQQLEQTGSTIYKLTWKTKVTPQQWQYCQLAASVPRTKENDSSSWPTPAARDYKGANSIPNTIKKMENGERAHMGQLANFAPVMVPWPTPSTQDNPQVRGEGAAANAPSRGTTLGGAARLLNAEMETHGKPRLNPRFSLWLMGFPIEWAYCGEQVTQSCRK